MPRIRKRTSKRGTTHERRKVTQKVRETRKKKAKAAKKNVQWKSKNAKDPGIPSQFPFKDQILAEIQEQRRLAAEDKEKRKEARRLAKTGATVPPEDEESGSEGEEDDTSAPESENHPDISIQDVGLEGIASISAKQLNAKALKKAAPAPVDEEESEEEDDAPLLTNPSLPTLDDVVNASDVILEVLDSRDPLAFRSKGLEELASQRKKKTALVLNKIDACPRETVSAWTNHLRTEFPTFIFRSASAFLPVPPAASTQSKKGKSKPAYHDSVGGDSVIKYLSKLAKGKSGKDPLTVALVGLTNSGKSSLLNSLLKSNSAPVHSLSSPTKGPTTSLQAQEVVLDGESGVKIRFIDTPGLSWRSADEDDETSTVEDVRARDILLRNKGRIDRLKDPLPPVSHIVSRASADDLMLLYNLPAFESRNLDAFVAGVARSAQLIKKKGILDTAGACRIILRDWNIGKLAWYTQPPSAASSSASTNVKKDALLDKLYSEDQKIIDQLPTRKELRKSGTGIVKLSQGQVESRAPALDVNWFEDAEASEESGSEEDEVEVRGIAGDEDSDEEEGEEEVEDEEEDDESEEEAAPLPTLAVSSRKHKRKRTAAEEEGAAPERKKVAFAADPKESKQARRAGSSKGKAAPKASVSSKPSKSKKATKPPTSSKGDESYDFAKYF